MVLISSCGSGLDTVGVPREITGSGTLGYTPIEGGCWYIEMDDTGEKLLVNSSVPSEFRLVGFRFDVRATVLRDVATICMFGTAAKIESMVPLTTDISGLDLGVSGSGMIYNSQCTADGTDHGIEWGILSDVTGNGLEYLLVPGLEPAFQDEGLNVNFEGSFINDVAPFCHQGRVINTTLLETKL